MADEDGSNDLDDVIEQSRSFIVGLSGSLQVDRGADVREDLSAAGCDSPGSLRA